MKDTWEPYYGAVPGTCGESPQLDHSDDRGEAWRVSHIDRAACLPFKFLRKSDCERAVSLMNEHFPGPRDGIADDWDEMRRLMATECVAW